MTALTICTMAQIKSCVASARAGKRLADETFDHIYASSLMRAFETAQAILKFHEDTACTVSEDLHEVTRYHFSPVFGELDPAASKCMALERDALERFANQLRHAHGPGEKVLVVSHGNFIRTLMPILGGRDPKESLLININNASITVLEVWASGEAILQLGNSVKHLLPSQVT